MSGPMKRRLIPVLMVAPLWPAIAAAADTLAVTRAEWVQLAPAASPDPRAAEAMAYDPVSGKIVLFGGLGADETYFGDTWTFDGVTWTKLTLALEPPARAAAGMTFDAAIQKLVMFGGYTASSGYFGDTWIFDGATGAWRAASPSLSPPAVTTPSMFPDPKNGRADVYGGYDGTSYQSGIWQFDGTTWLQLHPASSPTARAGAIAAFDYNAKNVVLSQGLSDLPAANTWTWDGVNWTERSPAQQPPLLFNAAAAFTGSIHVLVAFGGAVAGVAQNGTWAWTGSDWVQGQPTASPAARESLGMANDLAIEHIVIFGGQNGAKFFGDTWELRSSAEGQ
jgi:hypothetical protein